MKTFLILAVLWGLGLVKVLYSAFAITKVWEWLVTPYYGITFPMLAVAGVLSILGLLTFGSKVDEDPKEPYERICEIIAIILTVPTFLLLSGYVLSFWV